MEEKYQKRAKYILLFLFLVLIIFLTVFILKPSKYSSDYNGFFIQKLEDGYKTRLYIGDKGPYYINTNYHPKDVEGLKIDIDLKNELNGKNNVYIAIDPYDANLTGRTTVAALELNNVIEAFYRIPVGSAFTKEKDNHTIKTCPTKNNAEEIFLLQLDKETKILKSGNCIILKAQQQEELIKEADAIIFNLLGITR